MKRLRVLMRKFKVIFQSVIFSEANFRGNWILIGFVVLGTFVVSVYYLFII